MNFDDPTTVLKCLVIVYRNQTTDEQMSELTVHSNGIGFNKADSPFMSSIADRVLSGLPISKKQYEMVRQIIQKYSGQVTPDLLISLDIPDIEIYKPVVKTVLIDIMDRNLILNPRGVYPTSQIKSIKFRWNADSKYWYGLLSLENISELKKFFPDAEVSELVERYVENIDKVDDVEVTVHQSTFDFQKEAIKFMVSRDRGLLALAPGLGKTNCAIQSRAIDERILVVSPLALLYNWANEIIKWGNPNDGIEIWHKTFDINSKSKWIITNYDTLVRNQEVFMKIPFTTMFVDESILIKNRKTARFSAVSAMSKIVSKVWLLSGSPISKFVDDLWTQFNILDHTRYSSYWRFAYQYCMVEKSQWGTHIIANQPDAMQKIKENTRDIYHARTQDQVLDLPEFIFESVAVPMENGQEKAYSTMEDEFFAELPEGDVLLAPNVLSQLIRLIQIASNPILIGGVNESNKWKYAVEMLDYIDLPVIIWTNFINTAESIVNQIKAAKFRAASLTGRTPPIERQNIVDNFQNGNLDVIVAHPGVGKFGFTLTAARTAIYLERSYNGDDYFQSLHRIRRIGTTVSPRVIILLSVTQNMEETIDHVIDKILEFRKNSSLDMTQGLTSGVLRKMWRKND